MNKDLFGVFVVILLVGGFVWFFIWAIRDKRRRREYEASKARLKVAFQELSKAWEEQPPEQKEKIALLLKGTKKADNEIEAVYSAVGQLISPQKILMTADAIVTYQTNIERPLDILTGIFSPDSAEQRLKEILAAHPDVDLTKFESALGIKILDVQRKGQKQKIEQKNEQKKLPDEDNELGDIE